MIAKAKPHPESPEHGYIALHQHFDGHWALLTPFVYPTRDAALTACTNSAHSTLECAALYLERAQCNLARLADRPRPTDRVRLGDQIGRPDADGVFLMPPETRPPRRIHPLPDFSLDDALLDAFRQTMDLADMTRTTATSVIVDALLNNPADHLTDLADRHPELLADAAAVLVDVARRVRQAEGRQP